MPARTPEAKTYMQNPLAWLRKQIQKWGLENWAKRFYGIYPAQVIDNEDPDNLGRVRAIIPAIGISKKDDVPMSQWIMPCSPSLGTNSVKMSEDATTDGQMSGMFFPPDIGTNLWICFQWGDVRFPVYMGGFVTEKNKSTTFENALQKGIRTRSGHFLRFDDNLDNLSIMLAKGDGTGEPTSAFISIDKDDNVQISNGIGSTVYMNAKDKETTIMTSDGEDPPAAASLLFLGQDEITLATKSGGAFGMKGKNFTATGDNFVVDCKKEFNANTGSVSLGKGAKEPAVKGTMFMTNYTVHAHPSPGFGIPVPPSTPPIALYKELSTVVKVA